MDRYDVLKQLIDDSETLVVPDAYNGMTSRLIEFAGFKAVQCSGYSFSVSKKYRDESLISMEENIKTTEEIVQAVNVPVFADGEDGYGCAEVFKNSIDKFIKTGIAGINIEDQNIWAPYHPNSILPVSAMVEKINIVKELKQHNNIPNFVLNSRTDILGSYSNRSEGLKKAIERANIYLEAGADLTFITNVKTKEEIKLLNEEIDGPISIAAGLAYNITNYDINDCKEIGIARVSIPSTLILTALNSQLKALKTLKETGSFTEIKEDLMDIDILNELRLN